MIPNNDADAAFWRFSHDPNRDPKSRGQESIRDGRMASSVHLRLFFVGYMVWLMTLPMVSAAERFIPSVAWV